MPAAGIAMMTIRTHRSCIAPRSKTRLATRIGAGRHRAKTKPRSVELVSPAKPNTPLPSERRSVGG
jgi:hypothetical protein